jgi:hypothetical protein
MSVLSTTAAFSNPAVQTLTDTTIVNSVVDAGFAYYVTVNSSDWQGNIMGIVDYQITYTVPAAD